ncbi:spore coat protein [Clostridia bacterium]|nr:spore coat protein [Clostridia bacterium]
MVMDLNLKKEPIFVSEVVFDGFVEQGVEFDYVLPDYLPDIFKILKCSLTPCVVSYNITGSQLAIDGVVYIKVLYIAANTKSIKCIKHRYTYSKSIDLGKNADGLSSVVVSIVPKCNYCNGRPVSSRRIDIRGAVGNKIKVTATRETEMLINASGCGIETLTSRLSYCGEKLSTATPLVLREDIEAASSGFDGGAVSILGHDESVSVTDYKIIADKIVVKGEVSLKALYVTAPPGIPAADEDDSGYNADVPDSGTADFAEIMEAAIPFSQIIDLPGVTDRHVCFINVTILDSDLEVKSNDIGDNRIFAADLTLNISATAHLEKCVSPITDIYSTEYDSSYSVMQIGVETLPHLINEVLTLKNVLEAGEDGITEIIDARCEAEKITCKVNGANELLLSGQVKLEVMGYGKDGTPVHIEKQEPFETTVNIPGVSLTAEHLVDPVLQVTHTTYTISGNNQIELRVTLNLRGAVAKTIPISVVKDITVQPDKPKAKNTDYALKLYYAEPGESIWNIAKRYNTSAGAIIKENDIESSSGAGEIEAPYMLLIPIV